MISPSSQSSSYVTRFTINTLTVDSIDSFATPLSRRSVIDKVYKFNIYVALVSQNLMNLILLQFFKDRPNVGKVY